MKLPDLLPKELHFVAEANSEEELFQLLVKETALLIDFFENACEDETWCDHHPRFMKETIDWMTQSFFLEQLHLSFAKRAVEALQKHFRALDHLIPKKLSLTHQDQKFLMSALMVAVSSQVLYFRLQHQKDSLSFGNISLDHFLLFKEFIETERIESLWRYDLRQLIEIHTEAKELGLEGVMTLCADTMKRYLTSENIMRLLNLSLKEHWTSLRNHCIDFINSRETGAILKKEGGLSFEFVAFTSEAMELFSKLKERITHLISPLTEEAQFGTVLQQCPKLVSLDISRSTSKGPYLSYLPRVRELNLSYCGWLNEETIQSLTLEGLRVLKLERNTQLTYTFWQALLQFPRLEVLNVNYCRLGDEELKIILEATPRLQELYLKGCSQIGAALARQQTDLRVLDVSRTEIEDSTLIGLASHSLGLEELYLVRSDRVTEKGVLEVVRLCSHLRKIDLSHCNLSKSFIEDLRKKSPYLEILF